MLRIGLLVSVKQLFHLFSPNTIESNKLAYPWLKEAIVETMSTLILCHEDKRNKIFLGFLTIVLMKVKWLWLTSKLFQWCMEMQHGRGVYLYAFIKQFWNIFYCANFFTNVFVK